MDKYLTKTSVSRKRKSTEQRDEEETDQKAVQSYPGLEFVQKKGDLFSCAEKDALAHCVSADFRMGKGIAVLFKQKFGGVQELKDQLCRPGGVAVLKRGERFVYYLVTKEKVYNKPTYPVLKSSLEAMRDHCVKNCVQTVSMPRIGCGLDGLQWTKVADMIQDVFRNTDMTINVYTI